MIDRIIDSAQEAWAKAKGLEQKIGAAARIVTVVKNDVLPAMEKLKQAVADYEAQ